MKKVLRILLPAVVIISLFLTSCGASNGSTSDPMANVPSGSFVIEAGSGAETILSDQTESGKTITKAIDAYPVFYSTNKVKNHLNAATGKQYGKAQAFVLESPYWSSNSGQAFARSKMILGMTKELMLSQGLTPGQPSYITIPKMVDLINSKTMNLDVCNFTQCNSGGLLYFSVLNHFTGTTVLDLKLTDNSPESQAIIQQTKNLIQNISITTSTDADAKNAFLNNSNGYNAIWTYEAEVANINFARVSQGQEPIYAVYVNDSIDAAQTIYFSPYYQLTKEDTDTKSPSYDSQKVKEYKSLLEKYNKISAAFEKDETIRTAIANSGWRPAQYNAQPSTDVLKPEWGFVLDPQTSTSFAPKYEVSMGLLGIFTYNIRKPIIMFFIDDGSGSMDNYLSEIGSTGRQQLLDASNTLFVNGGDEFLQAIDSDITKVYLFDSECTALDTVKGSNTQILAQQIASTPKGGATSMFRCGVDALNDMAQYKPMCESTHNCAFVFMTDGQDNDCTDQQRSPCVSPTDFNDTRTKLGLDSIPVYGVPFGAADTSQMNQIKNMNICNDTIEDCFKKIKGSR